MCRGWAMFCKFPQNVEIYHNQKSVQFCVKQCLFKSIYTVHSWSIHNAFSAGSECAHKMGNLTRRCEPQSCSIEMSLKYSFLVGQPHHHRSAIVLHFWMETLEWFLLGIHSIWIDICEVLDPVKENISGSFCQCKARKVSPFMDHMTFSLPWL